MWNCRSDWNGRRYRKLNRCRSVKGILKFRVCLLRFQLPPKIALFFPQLLDLEPQLTIFIPVPFTMTRTEFRETDRNKQTGYKKPGGESQGEG